MSEKNYLKELALLCRDKANERYKISDIDGMHERMQTEICKVINKESHLLFLAAYEVVEYCKSKNIPYGSAFTSKFHLLAYFLGISEVNPLPYHYECECGIFEWVNTGFGSGFYGKYADGFELPDKTCPECGKTMHGDGHNLAEIEDDLCSINIPVKSEFKDEIITHLEEKFNGYSVRSLKHVDKDNVAHELKYSLSVMPAECELPDDCFTEPIPYGILVLSDYEPLADLKLLSQITNTDLSSIKFNDSKIYDSIYHFEDDAVCGESSVFGHIKLPVDFFVFEKAANFSGFIRRLGILKYLGHLSSEARDDILSGMNQSYYRIPYKEIHIRSLPYCVEEYLDMLGQYYWGDELIENIYGCIKTKRSASHFMPSHYYGEYEVWFMSLLDKCYHLEYKQNLITEAMEIYRTQYFAENYPLQFFKCKINEMRK
jgi:hypothetical protein